MDLLHHMHTALQVGRLSRASTIIQRLGDICSSDAPELLHAHTAYLEESLRTLALHGRGVQGRKVLTDMQKWFETEVRQKGVSVDAKMLVVMIRGSIRALSGEQQERTVHRYANMAQELGDEVYEEVLDSEDYDDNEFTILGRCTYQDEIAIRTPDSGRRPDPISVENLPEVLPTDQRGGGLASVKLALKELTNTSALPADGSVESQQEQAFRRQKLIEETSVDVALNRWRTADEELRKIGIHTSMQSKPITALMWQFYETLVPALEAELAACKTLLGQSQPGQKDDERLHYGPYLELLPISRIAATTILYTLNKMPHNKSTRKVPNSEKYQFEHKLGNLTVGLATAIEEECAVHSSKVKASRRKASKTQSKGKQGHVPQNPGHKKTKKFGKNEHKRLELLGQLDWPLENKVRLGAMLISKLIETAQLPVTRLHPRTREKITQMQPAFLHRVQYEHGRKLGTLAANPALIEKFESEPLASMLVKRMPMVVKPKPWSGWNTGGYISYSNSILRLPPGDKSGKDYFLAAHKRGDMGQIYAGLNALGEVPWKVHHGIFKVQLEAWNSGEEIANFAPLHPKLDFPPEPKSSTDTSARVKWLEDMRAIENKRTGLHSKRCFQNFQLETARSMFNETMWFPHNLDFRGRAYPIPPYLNHMGADTVRGLLVFAKGKELGPKGLRWLKIHLATVAGHDKASLSERIQFTEKHLDDIYDSVRNPLNGRRWWLQSEDPWQTLAACFELTDALDSPDPTKFVSHLPIQQDGTCNGLQHYAALGGDKIGAAQVNLEPGDRPADVYTAVAQAVIADVHEDALQGDPIALKLDGNITRKCVKQPVMTNVYGVTFFGAKEQVQRQLEVIFPNVRASDAVTYPKMSLYVATKIFKSLGTMFSGAQAIQQWLGECADRISQCITPEQVAELAVPKKSPTKSASARKSRKKIRQDLHADAVPGGYHWNTAQIRDTKPMFKTTVVWTTPLRLPVVQPYRTDSTRPVQTSLQRISLRDPKVWHPVSKRKQLQAFPPNFIHSLDATHMMLSALRCKELGITFASIHDSFWTHACDVDNLSVALRDAFVQMHKEDIIGRLREEFQTRYKGCMYFKQTLKSSSAGRKITEHRKQKKLSNGEELAEEMKRLRLLASEDPKERKEGESMVTPASIFEAEGDASTSPLPPEIASQQLGAIPTNDTTEATTLDKDVSAEHEDAEHLEEIEAEGNAVRAGIEALAESKSSPDAEAAGDPKNNKSGKATKIVPRYPSKIHVWVPLTFPEVPPKGEFDVRKIKDSNYFFH